MGVIEQELIEHIKEGNEKIVKRILENEHIDINLEIEKETPLSAAIEKGIFDICKILINDKRILINKIVQDRYRFNYLQKALFLNDKKIFKELLKHPDIDVNMYSRVKESTALYTSILFNSKDFFDVLLKHPDIDINKGTEKKSPLDLALEQTKNYYAEKLIEAGANISFKKLKQTDEELYNKYYLKPRMGVMYDLLDIYK